MAGILDLPALKPKPKRLDLDDLQINEAEDMFAAFSALSEARLGNWHALADRVRDGLDLTEGGRILAADIIRGKIKRRKQQPLSFAAERRGFKIALYAVAYETRRKKTAKSQAAEKWGCSLRTVEGALIKHEAMAKIFYAGVKKAATAFGHSEAEILASLWEPKHQGLFNRMRGLIELVPEMAEVVVVGGLASAMKSD
jgi:hypothetical protein